jgi:hypothetical protein
MPLFKAEHIFHLETEMPSDSPVICGEWTPWVNFVPNIKAQSQADVNAL